MIRCQVTSNPCGTDTRDINNPRCDCPTCSLYHWAIDTGKTDPIEALMAWNSEHKSHHVEITKGTGYGAACWNVKLMSCGELIVDASEVAFILSTQENRRLAFVIPPGIDMEDWPGLHATILAALRRVEEFRTNRCNEVR